MTARRLRLGMVGGGEGSFIGAVHRLAARMDDQYELVAGAFSSDPQRSARSGEALHVPADRIYADFETMARAEGARADRIDVVSVVTPNDSHYVICSAFLRAGIGVICDKPLTTTIEDARALRSLVQQTGLPFVVTHTYAGYPMVREARAMVAGGVLGKIRLVQVEYPQDWLSEPVRSKQADWRLDPAKSGPTGCTGDIGTHAHHLACYVSGLAVETLLAELSSMVPGRVLDDNAGMLLRFRGGARGMLWASQVAPGDPNGLRARVYGERGSLAWVQQAPNQLLHTPLGDATRTLFLGMKGLSPVAGARVPAGHPEGYLEAFAQLYTDAAAVIRAHAESGRAESELDLLPGIDAGVRGVAFIMAALRSSQAGGVWTAIEE
ncbi:Gfo/Idh/MocA family protein [Lichenicoccus sp.]|uniref:Gfo/Idh/MocA family protein n=1 Tax=Lichenicoccus sp. TaxID=2781899 RepID=UPI003D0D448A